MDKSTMETIQDYYAPDGMGGDWKEIQEKVDPNIREKYFNLLVNEGIFPATKEGLESYVFYSVSANQRLVEFGLAKELDALGANLNIENKPKIICADVFGKNRLVMDRTDGASRALWVFKPGFSGETPHFANVDISTVSAKANEIPLPDESVDVLWDRLGAMWHYLEYAQTHRKPVNESVNELLTEYGRVIKKNGRVIIDAGDVHGVSVSTYDLSQKGVEKVDFESLGWHVELKGTDSTQVAILSRVI